MALPLHERANRTRQRGSRPYDEACRCRPALAGRSAYRSTHPRPRPRTRRAVPLSLRHDQVHRAAAPARSPATSKTVTPPRSSGGALGELEGGVYPDTQRTYLSMGCNHCLTADCLRGCPTDAYTKDPLTGIVMHSADACIGCQYCVWNCPYSVPQFNPERGVVGKCDMCRGRLLDDLAPACVDACPESAIQIEIVNMDAWRTDFATADSPGLPPAGHTISTTRLTLPERSSAWLARVDTGDIPLEHAHPSLVLMTTAMQATFGTLAVLVLGRALDVVSITLLAVLTALALDISLFHLGPSCLCLARAQNVVSLLAEPRGPLLLALLRSHRSLRTRSLGRRPRHAPPLRRPSPRTSATRARSSRPLPFRAHATRPPTPPSSSAFAAPSPVPTSIS